MQADQHGLPELGRKARLLHVSSLLAKLGQEGRRQRAVPEGSTTGTARSSCPRVLHRLHGGEARSARTRCASELRGPVRGADESRLQGEVAAARWPWHADTGERSLRRRRAGRGEGVGARDLPRARCARPPGYGELDFEAAGARHLRAAAARHRGRTAPVLDSRGARDTSLLRGVRRPGRRAELHLHELQRTSRGCPLATAVLHRRSRQPEVPR